MSYWRRIPATLRGLLVVTVLGLPLVTPLLRWSAVPCTHDGHLHVHRVAAMRYAWENGVYFSRWIPDLALGHGYPFFVYREPTPLYAVMLPHLLGVPLPAASNLFYALCILAAGWFMFLWVKDVMGPRAAVVSAVAYMAAPYVLIDALVRGNAPESLALPLFPLLLWIGRRWMIRGSARTFLLSVLTLAFLSLSHNISVLIFSGIFLLYLVVVGRLHDLSWRPLSARLLLLFGLGLGATLFYTGGALLEMDQVTLTQSTVTRNNDFHYNFASWAEILAAVAPEDPDLLNPPLPIRLGWVPTLLALAGVATLLRKRTSGEQRGQIIFMSVAALLLLFMSLPAALPLWENLPLIDFVQFPWRFIGRAALPVAFLAGAPFAYAGSVNRLFAQRKKRFWPQFALFAAISLLIIEALPNVYPRYCREQSFPTINDVHAYEQATGLVGIDPEGSYFPRTVQKRPKESPLLVDYLASEKPRRFDLSSLPVGATATAEYDPLAATIQINTPAPFTARYLSFAFPGWVVTVDDQRVPVTPSDPEGLITFTVPAGEHLVTVRWQSTLLRTILSLLSILSIVGIVVTAVLLKRRSSPFFGEEGSQADEGMPYGSLALLGVGFLLFKFLVFDSGYFLWRTGGAPPVDHSMGLTAGELSLEGYVLPDGSVEAGKTFDIDLAWRLLAPTQNRYQSNVWLAGPEGLLWSDKDTQRPRLYEDAPPTTEWGVDQWAWDSREVAVLPGTPPGEYDLVLTLFDRDTLQPLTFYEASGGVVGPTAVIGQVEVEEGDEAPSVEPQYSSGQALPGTGLTLLGYNLGREAMAPGEEILLTLFWQRGEGPVARSFEVQLRDEGGEFVQSWELPVTRADYELSDLRRDSTLRGQYLLRLSAALDSGEYRFSLQDSLPLREVSVDAPQRVFTEPHVEKVVNIAFAEGITLLGYTLSESEDSLAIEMVWSPASEIDRDLHVFVHLVNENGEIVAQADGQPENWTRPTTGWAPREYILDRHTIPMAEAQDLEGYDLYVGLYDPETGQRLAVQGTDFVQLTLAQ